MSKLNRLGAIESIASRRPPAPCPAAPVETGLYAEDVFNEQTMRRYHKNAKKKAKEFDF